MPQPPASPFGNEESAGEDEVVDGELTGSAAPAGAIRAEVISTGLDAPTQVVTSPPSIVDTGQMPYAGAGYPHAPGAVQAPAGSAASTAPVAPSATDPATGSPGGWQAVAEQLAAHYPPSQQAPTQYQTGEAPPTASATAPAPEPGAAPPTAAAPAQYSPPAQYSGQFSAPPYSAVPMSAPPYPPTPFSTPPYPPGPAAQPYPPAAPPYPPAAQPYPPQYPPAAQPYPPVAQPASAPPWAPPGQPPVWGGGAGFPAGPVAPPASPYPGYPPPYYLPEPPRRNRRGLIVTAVIAGFVVLALCAGLIGYGLPSVFGDGDSSTSAQPTAVPATSAASLPADATDDQIVQATLDAQSAALLRGDQAGWLAPVDPAASSAVSAYKRLYHNLIELHVKAWKTSSSSLVDLSGGGKHTFTMTISYCFNSTACDGVRTNMKVTAAKKNGKVLFEGLAAPKPSALANQPLPWQVSTLTAVVGSRVVLAASATWASQLSKVLPVAESAATAADKYAKWGTPTNYVIYLASASEGKTWYNGGLKNADGISYTISPRDIQMVIMMPYATEQAYAGPGEINTVIQHEMGHVVTLWSMTNRGIDHDDFIEGIAEYIAYTGHTSWAKYRIYDTRAYIRAGKWSNKCYLTTQIVSSNVLTSSAAYGIGYLTMRYLATKYGQAKMLSFWGAVERDGLSLDAAAKQTFSTSWTSVNSSCVTYVRHAVGA